MRLVYSHYVICCLHHLKKQIPISCESHHPYCRLIPETGPALDNTPVPKKPPQLARGDARSACTSAHSWQHGLFRSDGHCAQSGAVVGKKGRDAECGHRYTSHPVHLSAFNAQSALLYCKLIVLARPLREFLRRNAGDEFLAQQLPRVSPDIRYLGKQIHKRLPRPSLLHIRYEVEVVWLDLRSAALAT